MPAFVKIEPTGQHQVGLFGEAIPVRIGEDEFALVVQEDFEYALVDIGVTGRADSDEVLRKSRTSAGVGDEVVKVEPDFVGASGCGAAPAFPSQNLSLLSFGGVSVARIEADSFVVDRREGILQRFHTIGVCSCGG